MKKKKEYGEKREYEKCVWCIVWKSKKEYNTIDKIKRMLRNSLARWCRCCKHNISGKNHSQKVWKEPFGLKNLYNEKKKSL